MDKQRRELEAKILSAEEETKRFKQVPTKKAKDTRTLFAIDTPIIIYDDDDPGNKGTPLAFPHPPPKPPGNENIISAAEPEPDPPPNDKTATTVYDDNDPNPGVVVTIIPIRINTLKRTSTQTDPLPDDKTTTTVYDDDDPLTLTAVVSVPRMS